MKKWIIALIFGLLAAPVKAQLSGCQYTSGPQTLSKVRATASGSQIIGCINDSFDRLSSTVAAYNSTTSIHTADLLNVRRIFGISTGTAGIRFSSFTYHDAGTYDNNLGSGTISGPGGLGVTYGLVSGSATVNNALTVIGTAAVQGNAFSVGASTFVVSQGRVGIGTTSPSNGNILEVNSGGAGVASYLGIKGGRNWQLVAASNTISSPFFIKDVNQTVPAFFATYNGLNGIGTASPCSTCTLHVAGNASVTGTAQVGTLKFNDGTTLTTAGSGVGDTTNSGAVSLTSTLTFTGGGLDVSDATNCVGLACRVGYSSGTYNNFSFVLQDSTTYDMSFRIFATSGTNSTNGVFKCGINDNTTGANYRVSWFAYTSAYHISNTGGAGVAEFPLNSCGGGAVTATDYAVGTLRLAGVNGRLTATGIIGNSCQGGLAPAAQVAMVNANYLLPGPWTIKCWPLASVGWDHEAILYKVGK